MAKLKEILTTTDVIEMCNKVRDKERGGEREREIKKEIQHSTQNKDSAS